VLRSLRLSALCPLPSSLRSKHFIVADDVRFFRNLVPGFGSAEQIDNSDLPI
jgi:hypothetical protein